jgi:glycosyltransferase involved in cell wall biosynthesis
MIAALLFWVCFSTIAWVYAGYPLLLIVLGKLMPRPRRRDPIILPVSVIVVAHNEEAAMEAKVRNILASDYPAGCIEVVVASDGSTDGTVDAARRGGARIVMDLPRVGKTSAINRAAKRSGGDVLIFTDADFRFEPGTLAALISNFADDSVGGVAGSKATVIRGPDGALARGEGLYWRYDLWVSRLEDRIGSTVSANGFLYAIRRNLFEPTSMPAGSDDVLISTGVIKSGKRLAFDEHSRVLSESRTDPRYEFRRKVRLMNRGLRASFSLSRTLPPVGAGFYSLQLFSHKILRRFLPFFLAGLLASSIRLVIVDPSWWASLGPQLAFYGLAGVGALMGGTRFGSMKPLWIPYYFCLANLAAAVAVISLLRGVRFERWEPVRASGRSGDLKVER